MLESVEMGENARTETVTTPVYALMDIILKIVFVQVSEYRSH